MGSKIAWKKLISDSETISYVKNVGDYRIIIEARQFDEGWEIVKKYLGAGLNFVETYSAHSPAELRSLLKHLRSERDLSRNEIKDISRFKKKTLKVLVRRGWKERTVEKWFFGINDNFSNYVVIRYGKELDVDIVMEEQLKYIEDKVITKLYEVLGISDTEQPINQAVYYFTKKTNAYLETDIGDYEFSFYYE